MSLPGRKHVKIVYLLFKWKNKSIMLKEDWDMQFHWNNATHCMYTNLKKIIQLILSYDHDMLQLLVDLILFRNGEYAAYNI